MSRELVDAVLPIRVRRGAVVAIVDAEIGHPVQRPAALKGCEMLFARVVPGVFGAVRAGLLAVALVAIRGGPGADAPVRRLRLMLPY